ncbi:MAG: ferric reductase-like transmembrane domain-containing protein [Gammaproteobacteria bacterium]
MNQVTKALNSKYFILLLLGLPLLAVTLRYLAGSLYYGEYLHVTGEFSARLLLVTLAVTPLSLAWPKQRWTQWLRQRRRYLGVATFAYALPHLAAYLVKLGKLSEIVNDAVEPGIWTGWLAILLFVPLALTSNNSAARRLGPRWKTLHRLVYAAALLSFAHWILIAFNPGPGWAHLSVLVALETFRVFKTRRSRGN